MKAHPAVLGAISAAAIGATVTHDAANTSTRTSSTRNDQPYVSRMLILSP